MSIPENAVAFAQPMDPSDLIDYTIVLSQGDDPADMLTSDENVANYTLSLTTEAMAAGLQLQNSGGYQTTLDGNALKFWLAVDPSLVESSTFDDDGLILGIEITIMTTSTPPRRRQRTVTVQVQNQ